MDAMLVARQTTRHLIICSNFPSATINKGAERPALRGTGEPDSEGSCLGTKPTSPTAERHLWETTLPAEGGLGDAENAHSHEATWSMIAQG